VLVTRELSPVRAVVGVVMLHIGSAICYYHGGPSGVENGDGHAFAVLLVVGVLLTCHVDGELGE